jgi:hypothetical protein
LGLAGSMAASIAPRREKLSRGSIWGLRN